MAITKIHAIKATVSGAINYICNEDKTDSSLLISYFGTTPKTAADDFKFTLSHTDRKSVFQASKLLFLKHFVKTECAKPRNRSPGANHEYESACSEFCVHC